MMLNCGKKIRRSCICWILLAVSGCQAPQTPVPTVWQKLGIPQAGARFRDGLINRRGNFPGLEKKPPVRALADPANLEPGQPEMIKAAAEIKQDQDLKKQKIKAIKFLAEVNCGCYNKEGKVEAAFLAALEDCDPDVRMTAIEGLETAAGPNCGRCNVCCTTCNTPALNKKLEEIANGLKDGCPVEPVKEIRQAAAALLRRCPPPPEPPVEPEELIPPEPVPMDDDDKEPGFIPEGFDIPEEIDGAETIPAQESAYRINDEAVLNITDKLPSNGSVSVAEDVQDAVYDGYEYQNSSRNSTAVQSSSAAYAEAGSTSADPLSKASSSADDYERELSIENSSRYAGQEPALEAERLTVANPEEFLAARTIAYDPQNDEVLVQTEHSLDIHAGKRAVIVDLEGYYSPASVAKVQANRIILKVDSPDSINLKAGQDAWLGIVAE